MSLLNCLAKMDPLYNPIISFIVNCFVDSDKVPSLHYTQQEYKEMKISNQGCFKGSIFRNITPYIALKIQSTFRRNMSPSSGSKNKPYKKSAWNRWQPELAWFILRPWSWRQISPKRRLTLDYRALYLRIENSSRPPVWEPQTLYKPISTWHIYSTFSKCALVYASFRSIS
jgi:hypothetical protein